MSPPYLIETPYRVILEFKKSNTGVVKRTIELAYTPLEVPAQLQGRIPIEVWDPFMEEVSQLAKEHPYTTSQSAEECCFNIGGLTCAFCIGFGVSKPDGGDYGVWESKVAACVHRHSAAFARGGCNLSMHNLGGAYWIQIDVNPAMAVGYPGLPLDPETLPPPPNVKPPPRPYPEEAIPSVSMYPYDGMPPPPVPTPPYYTPPAVGPGMLPPAYYPPPPITGAGVTPGVLYPYPGVPPPKHY